MWIHWIFLTCLHLQCARRSDRLYDSWLHSAFNSRFYSICHRMVVIWRGSFGSPILGAWGRLGIRQLHQSKARLPNASQYNVLLYLPPTLRLGVRMDPGGSKMVAIEMPLPHFYSTSIPYYTKALSSTVAHWQDRAKYIHPDLIATVIRPLDFPYYYQWSRAVDLPILGESSANVEGFIL